TLQAVAWMDLYRQSRKKDLSRPTDITALTGVKLPDQRADAINAILATRTDKPHEAGLLAFTFPQNHGPESLRRPAARLLAMKSTSTRTTSSSRWRSLRILIW